MFNEIATWEEAKVFLTGFSALLGVGGLILAIRAWPGLIVYLGWALAIVVGAFVVFFLSFVIGAATYRARGKALPESLQFLNNPAVPSDHWDF